MPSTFSPALRLELIGNGEQAGNWGNTTNTNLGTLLEQAITGVGNIVMTDTNYTLVSGNGVADEARNAVLVVTGTLTITRSLIVPTNNKFYAVRNATTGGQSILVRTSGGTGVTLANGFTQLMYCDGTNVVLASVPINASNGNMAVSGAASIAGNITTNGSVTAVNGFVGNLTGTASSATTVVGVVAVSNGGTGSTTAPAARSALGATAVGDAVFTAVDASAARTATQSAATGAIGSSGLTMNTSRILGRTTGGSGAVEEITVGSGLSLSSGSLSVIPAGVSGALLNVQFFTSSGTYFRTAGATRAVVMLMGGGGGSGGTATGGGAGSGGGGGTTIFGSHVSAAGGGGGGPSTLGSGAPGVGGSGGSGANIAIRGQWGITTSGTNGFGGGSGGGGPATNGVSGGGGGSVFINGCCGPVTGMSGTGGQGEYAMKYITSGLNATESVTVGGGGSAGSAGAGSTSPGRSGGAGYVIVYEYS